jgi:catalase-peroxidase
MAWHSAGTYRTHDGRGGGGTGQLRLAPLNSWPDNANLDKARRLLWPIKQKYGRKISWADLMILTGNVALESMGFPTFGFAGGRVDAYEPELVDWGEETQWLDGTLRYPSTTTTTTSTTSTTQSRASSTTLEQPLAAVQMGLIYVNPAGPNGIPDPLASARDIRETFGRMAMNDEETVALIAGGHTFGKCHGAAAAAGGGTPIGPEPEGAPIELQGLGWKNHQRGGTSTTITSGFEGAWTSNPTRWDRGYLDTLFGYDWELYQSPAGNPQWKPKGTAGDNTVPDAHTGRNCHFPIMTTADLALRKDHIYEPIARRFQQQFDDFATVFAKAWYKLTHRDMGPYCRCWGPEVPPPQLWQDPVPPVPSPSSLMTLGDQHDLKQRIVKTSGLSIARLVTTAWASAVTYRDSDKRGGTNGGRLRLAPQTHWNVNEPVELQKALQCLEQIQHSFHETAKQRGRSVQVSMADLIVLGGCAAVEAAAQAAGYKLQVPFTPGRTDATAEMTDVDSFAVLEPVADGFRNYFPTNHNNATTTTTAAEHLFIDKAQLLTLTAPELVVLVGGLRALGVGTSATTCTLTAETIGTLNTSFFRNLLDMQTEWKPVNREEDGYHFEGIHRTTRQLQYRATRIDLVIGSNSILRSIAEVHACDDSGPDFCAAFCTAFAKVMDLGRFDIAIPRYPHSRM